MAELTLTCPHCGFSRTLPAESVPERPLRVTCPQCRESFPYRKPGALPAPPEPASPPPPPAAAPAAPLRGIGELFRDTWEIYVRRVGVLMALYLLAILFLLLPVGLFALFGGALSAAMPDLRTPLVGAGALTGIVVGSIALFWGLAAMVFAVADESLGIQAALERGWRRVWAFAWVFGLTGFIVTGGFLLFVIPGILFSVWFFLSQFVLVAEDERGMRALLKSKAYMQGCSFDVFLRLLVVWFASLAVGMVPLLGPLLSLLFVPFMMIYGWLIYEDLRSRRGNIPFRCTAGDKAAWVVLGALGFVILPLFILLLVVGWLGGTLASLTLPWKGFGF